MKKGISVLWQSQDL